MFRLNVPWAKVACNTIVGNLGTGFFMLNTRGKPLEPLGSLCLYWSCNPNPIKTSPTPNH